MRRITVALFLSVLSAPSGSCEVNPSYEQTVAFILEKSGHRTYSSNDGLNNIFDTRYQLEFTSRCEVKESASTDGLIGGYQTSTLIVQVADLKAFDPSTVDAEKGNLTLKTTSGIEVVHVKATGTGKYYQPGESDRSEFFLLDLRSSDDAIRVAKAFSHLIRLCGGEEELF